MPSIIRLLSPKLYADTYAHRTKCYISIIANVANRPAISKTILDEITTAVSERACSLKPRARHGLLMIMAVIIRGLPITRYLLSFLHTLLRRGHICRLRT